MVSFLQMLSLLKSYSLQQNRNLIGKTFFLTHSCLKCDDYLMMKLIKNYMKIK